MTRGTTGSSSPRPWRATITRSPPVSVPGSGPSSRGRGRTTPKHPDAIAAFQATGPEPRHGVIPPQHTRPVRVLSQAARRVGLLTSRRCRLTAGGIPPVGPSQQVFEWFSIAGAVAPVTDERFLLELPSRNADTLQLWVDAFDQAFPDGLHNLPVGYQRRAHRPAHVLARERALPAAATILSGAEPP